MNNFVNGLLHVLVSYCICFVISFAFLKLFARKKPEQKKPRKRAKKQVTYYLSKAEEPEKDGPVAIRGTLLSRKELDELMRKGRVDRDGG